MKVAIIGAGISGIASAAACVEEGIEYVIYERHSEVGGIWHVTNDDTSRTCMYEGLIMNTSRQLSGFSDFPIPEDAPVFLRPSSYHEYLRAYCTSRGIQKHVRFHTSVETVEPLSGGRWLVKSRSLLDDSKQEEAYDGVMVATGHFWERVLPEFPGADKFEGETLHSGAYRSPDMFNGKRVAVIGFGNSGGDIAVEASRVSRAPVSLSSRKGTWMVGRRALGGQPADHTVNRLFYYIPTDLSNAFTELLVRTLYGDPKMFGFAPNFRFDKSHPGVNSEIFERISTGQVVMRPNVKEILPRGVAFSDGSKCEADVLVYCTGYRTVLPFLKGVKVILENGELDLYKMIIPPGFDTLGMIGLIEPLGATAPVVEMQARWFVRSLKKFFPLPSKVAMAEHAAAARAHKRKMYLNNPRHALLTDLPPYMDDLAGDIGCLPSLYEVLRDFPNLVGPYLLGPTSPTWYRLYGPGKWNKAAAYLDRMSRSLGTYTHTHAGPLGEGKVIARYEKKSSGLVHASLLVGGAALVWLLWSRSRGAPVPEGPTAVLPVGTDDSAHALCPRCSAGAGARRGDPQNLGEIYRASVQVVRGSARLASDTLFGFAMAAWDMISDE
eukprot:Rmarinus@m.12916